MSVTNLLSGLHVVAMQFAMIPGGVGMVEIEFDTTMSKSRLCALFCMWLDWWSICLDEVLGRKRCRIVSCEIPLLRYVYVRNTK